jgi:hypothetical protein
MGHVIRGVSQLATSVLKLRNDFINSSRTQFSNVFGDVLHETGDDHCLSVSKYKWICTCFLLFRLLYQCLFYFGCFFI